MVDPLTSKAIPALMSLLMATEEEPEPTSKLPVTYEIGAVTLNAVEGEILTLPAVVAIPVKEALVA